MGPSIYIAPTILVLRPFGYIPYGASYYKGIIGPLLLGVTWDPLGLWWDPGSASVVQLGVFHKGFNSSYHNKATIRAPLRDL